MTEWPFPASVLVANRGEIARRILRTVRELGLRSIAVYDPDDRDLPFVQEADEAIELVGSALPSPYLDVALLLRAARDSGAGAVHPGYGFLSERASFARAVTDAGLRWIGPDPGAIEAMGDKINAKALMSKADMPLLPGSDGPVSDLAAAREVVATTGYPVMVKASAGGGGMGMAIVRNDAELAVRFEKAQDRARHLFADPAMLVERYVERARHIEVQIFGQADGTVVALGERDCSVQRRHQKVVEEAPSPLVNGELRQRLCAAAVRAGEAIGYRNAGTVEFVLDTDTHEFFFLEMNTRLQVEHPITECVAGVDLVEAQIRTAFGRETVGMPSAPEPRGHAIECRVYAEDPVRFLPSPGTITRWREPAGPGVRVDAGYVEGNTVSRRYDPLLAKLVVHGEDRAQALARARTAVGGFKIAGVRTNLEFLKRVLDRAEFIDGAYDTSLVSRMTTG
ncbi:acetyl/propionyl/methylcrotonyl-CoA carboxylase subunit alpha [Saccharopolyspora sp. ASAGF58]|uniref:acetyl-CoA carboxylase biotin carboxylase subunit n=1 Tax=Saccharopolyspora sp. ASAGF58 TaxID=2719023 RepID=UPI00143FD7DE|nr:biotin carboxylase N-terminal domain-containing protein [Saccharopolyspora sp. ASAGF58]QIZ37994.1 ATP-grasp domain-containing protein [Saccharopolyspora sp. ASAGF58]